jgi:predicted metalloprotease with PDZ domain
MVPARAACAVLLLILVHAPVARAQAPISYRLSFPERVHRLMDVEITFRDVPPGPLQLRMSRSSPGRYAAHNFAKNVFDVRAADGSGGPLPVERPGPHQWDVTGHPGTVVVSYRVYGDRVDGTYLAIDSTHAHINMPAALMWARGMERRPVAVRFEQPPGSSWRVATQLLAGTDAFTFTAPNLQYLMDSPSEFGVFSLRTFTVNDDTRVPVFRVAAHHTGTDAELDSFVRGVEAIVREARHVFGEFPAFEGNTYTFIADYLPWANGDGMEHRNSTILTSSSSIRSNRLDLLDTAAHEFFHAWNVERIRPAPLEPFDFEDASLASELWFAEGFTSYYAPLLTKRTDLTTVRDFARTMGRAIDAVLLSPGRTIRSVVEMSQFAPFVDEAAAIDPTSADNTFTSYYTWGQVIALGLDLTLRDRSDGRVTLDTFMRALWDRHGRPGQATTTVERPYTMDDLKQVLASVSGDAAFANDFFARYIEGRETIDYAPLLARAGFLWRRVSPGRAYAGVLRLEDEPDGVRVAAATLFGSPVYRAGIDREDRLVSVGGVAVSTGEDVERAIQSRKPGEAVPIVFERRGRRVTSTIELIEDPRHELVPMEEAGQTLTDAQRRVRDAWLSSAARNVF